MIDESKENQLDISNIVHEYSDDLYRFAMSKINDHEIAQDLVQDTLMVVIEKPNSFRGESNPKTWLIAILKNKIMDFYRKKSKSHISEKDLNDVSESFSEKGWWNANKEPFLFDHSEHLLDDENFVKVFYDCINGLPNLWESVIKMKYIDPKESKIICKELDISDSNLWQIVHRAKLKLKDCLKINWIQNY